MNARAHAPLGLWLHQRRALREALHARHQRLVRRAGHAVLLVALLPVAALAWAAVLVPLAIAYAGAWLGLAVTDAALLGLSLGGRRL